MTLYSANNTPYSAMSGVMTGDSDERTVLSSYRFVAAMLAQLIVGGFTLPLVAKFGHGNNAVGWQKTMTLWAVVCVVCFVITFLTTRERIQPPPQQKSEPRADFKNLLKNGPWIAMFVLTLSHFIFVAMRGGTMFYYFNYYVDKAKLLEFLQGLGLPQATAASPDGGHYLMNVLGLILAADRSNVASVGFSLFNIASQGDHGHRRRALDVPGDALRQARGGARRLHADDGLPRVVHLHAGRRRSARPTASSWYARCATRRRFRSSGRCSPTRRTTPSGRRDAGRRAWCSRRFSSRSRPGLSLGGAIAGWLLSGYGYQPNTTQTEHALMGIRLTVSVYPAIFLVVVVVCLLRYRITRARGAADGARAGGASPRATARACRRQDFRIVEGAVVATN